MIKKIDKKALDVMEIVNGPYNKKKAIELSENYTSKYRIKNIDIYSKVYSFKELLISPSLLNASYTDSENIWKPPKGIFIFAIVHNIVNIAVYKKKDIISKDFNKFIRYGEINNVIYINRIFYRSFYKITLDILLKMWYKIITKTEDKCLIIA